jgi:hypothetical protein
MLEALDVCCSISGRRAPGSTKVWDDLWFFILGVTRTLILMQLLRFTEFQTVLERDEGTLTLSVIRFRMSLDISRVFLRMTFAGPAGFNRDERRV